MFPGLFRYSGNNFRLSNGRGIFCLSSCCQIYGFKKSELHQTCVYYILSTVSAIDRIVEITLRTSKENKIMVEIDEPFFEHFAIVGLFLDSHERTYIANI